jgi:hypothetical protein
MWQNTEVKRDIKMKYIYISLKKDEMGRACSTNGGEEECI